jgi:hypothetical protein
MQLSVDIANVFFYGIDADEFLIGNFLVQETL